MGRSGEPHSERVRGFLAPLPGCELGFGYIPGVREKRVRLANIPAASGVHGLSGFTEVLRRNCNDGGDQLLGFDRFA